MVKIGTVIGFLLCILAGSSFAQGAFFWGVFLTSLGGWLVWRDRESLIREVGFELPPLGKKDRAVYVHPLRRGFLYDRNGHYQFSVIDATDTEVVIPRKFPNAMEAEKAQIKFLSERSRGEKDNVVVLEPQRKDKVRPKLSSKGHPSSRQ